MIYPPGTPQLKLGIGLCLGIYLYLRLELCLGSELRVKDRVRIRVEIRVPSINKVEGAYRHTVIHLFMIINNNTLNNLP